MSEVPGIRVLVVDDHDIVHWGFRMVLDRQSWVERCDGATGVAESVEIAARLRPDVALIDLLLGPDSGAEACAEIRRVSPNTKVLLISGTGRLSPSVARGAGAAGFISKNWDVADVIKAVRLVALGSEVFADDPAGPGVQLSEREQEVLSLLATGATNREIADSLYLSLNTVKEYTSAIYRKLEVKNRTEAVRSARGLGLVA